VLLDRLTIDTAIVLAVLVVMLWALVLSSPLGLLKVFLFYLGVEGALKLLSEYHAGVHIGADILLLIIIVSWLGRRTASQRLVDLRLDAIGRLTIVFILYCIGLIFHPYSYSFMASLAAMKSHVTMIPLFFLAQVVVRTREDVYELVSWMIHLAAFVCLMGLVEYQFFHSEVINLNPIYFNKTVDAAWVDSAGQLHSRPFGTTNVPGGAVSWAVLTAPFLFISMIEPGLVWSRAIGYLSLPLFIASIPLSAERSALYAVVIGLVAMFFLLRNRFSGQQWFVVGGLVALSLATFIGLGFAFFGGAFNDRWGSVRQPFDYWAERRGKGLVRAVAQIVERYPLGVGLGRIGPAAHRFVDENTVMIAPEATGLAADSYWAPMLIETGVPGTAIVLAIVLGLLVIGIRNHTQLSDRRLVFCSGAILGLHISLFASWYNGPVLMANPYQSYFWLSAGLLLRLAEIDRQSRRARALDTPAAQTYPEGAGNGEYAKGDQ